MRVFQKGKFPFLRAGVLAPPILAWNLLIYKMMKHKKDMPNWGMGKGKIKRR